MSKPYNEILDDIIESENKAVVAPAGHGKTYTLIQLVKKVNSKCLVLTHTNAGVSAIKKAISKAGVDPSKYTVKTIDSLCLTYCQRYPDLSGWTVSGLPSGAQWNMLRDCSLKVFSNKHIQDVLNVSYDFIFVDEYQDCNLKQHKVILLISKSAKLRVLGDPMQSIFQFSERNEKEKFSWTDNVESELGVITELTEPHRWNNTCPDLGKYIYRIRNIISSDKSVQFKKPTPTCFEVFQIPRNDQVSILAACQSLPNTVVIHVGFDKAKYEWIVERSSGLIQPVEKIDLEGLFSFTSRFDSLSGNDVCILVYKYLKNIFTNFTGRPVIHTAFNTGKLPTRLEVLNDIDINIISLARDKSLNNLLKCFELDDFFQSIPAASRPKCKRKELLSETIRAIKHNIKNPDFSLSESAEITRMQTSHSGRPHYNCVIGSTLLVKGLEFDNAIVLYPEDFRKKEDFYVAISRATKKVILISETDTFNLE